VFLRRLTAGADDERLRRGLLDLGLEPFDLGERLAVELGDEREQLVVSGRPCELPGDDPVEGDLLRLQVELAQRT
jgi:hypothetical protein